MFSAPVNLVAILVAAVANMVIGALWYSPALFGKQWMKAMGIKASDMDKDKNKMGMMYGLTGVAALVTSYVLAHFIVFAGEKTAFGGAKIAFWVWIGFIVTKSLVDVLFESKNWNIYYISMGYQLVALLTMGAILGAWR